MQPHKHIHSSRLLNRLTFRQLQVFQAVYRLRSYSRTAETIGLTQPAVSAQIKQLEQALGDSLFEYSGKTLHVTPAGEFLASAIERVFDEINHLEMQLSDLSGNLRGELRISTVSSAQYVMPWILARFSKAHPDIAIKLQVVNRDRAMQSLEEQHFDLAILSMVTPKRELGFIPFLANQLIAVLPKQHQLAQCTSLSPEQFLHEPLLVRETGSGTRFIVDEYYTHVRVTPRQLLELGSLEAIKAGLEENMGVAILPWVCVRKELQQGLFVSPQITGLPLRRSWSIVHSRQRPMPPTAQVFCRFVSQHLAELEEEFGTQAFEQTLLI
jgi:LysR family transcriptional regulator, putative pyruvate carboxylase regulator